MVSGPRWKPYLRARRRGLAKQQLSEWVAMWLVGNLCRGCGAVIEAAQFAVWHTYWGAMLAPCHAACREAGMKAEAYECQCIDADCNDCRHFKRGEVIKRWLSCMEDGKPSMRLVNMGLVTGHCLKLNLPVMAQPNKWSGLPCFEHRRSPQPQIT